MDPLEGNIRDLNWHLLKLKLESARNKKALDEEIVRSYFKANSLTKMPEDFSFYFRQLLEKWNSERRQRYEMERCCIKYCNNRSS